MAAEVPDLGARLGHAIIRSYNGDDLDPHFLDGHPNLGRDRHAVVRSCFYHSVLVTPKMAMLFDNMGRGGMCHMSLDEFSALWDTPALLRSLGLTWEQLRDGARLATEQALPSVPPPDPALLAPFLRLVERLHDAPEDGPCPVP